MQPKREVSRWQRLKRWLVSGYGVASVLCIALFTFALHSTDFFKNSRALPGQARTTLEQFQSWVHEDDEWTGRWSANPEGYVDVSEMGLSNTDTEIVILAEGGELEGTIASRTLCRAYPLFNYVQLTGHVSGVASEVVALDWVGGHLVRIAKLRLERSGVVMKVQQIAGDQRLFPHVVTLAREPGSRPKPDQNFCEPERKSIGWPAVGSPAK